MRRMLAAVAGLWWLALSISAADSYSSIDGRHLKQYVEELAGMSRHYRDQRASAVLYWHSDRETPDIIPAASLAATTRAYAKKHRGRERRGSAGPSAAGIVEIEANRSKEKGVP